MVGSVVGRDDTDVAVTRQLCDSILGAINRYGGFDAVVSSVCHWGVTQCRYGSGALTHPSQLRNGYPP